MLLPRRGLPFSLDFRASRLSPRAEVGGQKSVAEGAGAGAADVAAQLVVPLLLCCTLHLMHSSTSLILALGSRTESWKWMSSFPIS